MARGTLATSERKQSMHNMHRGMPYIAYSSYSLDGDGLRLRVGLNPDFKVRPALERFVIRKTQEPNLVQSIAGVADQFTQEHVPIGVQAVDDHVHQSVHLQAASARFATAFNIARLHRRSEVSLATSTGS